jgi:hypothetical protein
MARGKKPSAGPGSRVRSAITGRFVKKSAAKKSPRTTIVERIKPGRGKKK